MTQLDQIYTADEAAERLRLTNRGVIKLARQHGLCSRRGREYLFSESDLLALWEVLREPPTTARSPPLKAEKVEPYDIWLKRNAWRFKPSVNVDLRQMEVLRSISRTKGSPTHRQIDRAGPATIERLLALGMICDAGTNDQGETRVSLTEQGRKQISIVDKWIEQCVANGRKGGRWARHLRKST